ncbi:MAG: cobalamin-dependent protein [Nitrospirae bacterium]|nr:cobalamin-dependent protein [Nitrospirota bacterium]
MKILLINPSGGYPHEFPPLGILSIASVLKNEGHAVGFFDEGAFHRDNMALFDYVREFSPDVFGISLYTSNIVETFKTVSILRSIIPKSTIVVGGPHATVLPERTMFECRDIDFLICGEGELTAKELIESLQGKLDVHQVKGLYFREKEAIVKTGQREFIADLDTIPNPDHDFVARFSYSYGVLRAGKKVATIMSSRGCPFDCSFCAAKAVWRRSFRRRSPENVAAEIELLINNYGYDEIYFMDDLFAVDRNWLDKLYVDMKKRSILVPWKCLGRVDLLSFADYQKMADNGCYLIQFGVESGDDDILKDINKKINTDQVRKAFAEAKKARLNTYGFFIVGHNMDTYETILKTIYLARYLNPDFVSFFASVPFPGTKLHDALPEHVKYNWNLIRYTSYWQDKMPVQLCQVDSQDLRKFELQAHTAVYVTASYFINMLFGLRRKRILFWKLLMFFVQLKQRLFFSIKGTWILARFRNLDLTSHLRKKSFSDFWIHRFSLIDISDEVKHHIGERVQFYGTMQKAISSFNAANILGVGCGTIIDSHHLSLKHPDLHFIATDKSPEAVKIAAKIGTLMGTRTKILVDDEESMQFDRNQFDIVFSQGLLGYSGTPERLLMEQMRVLKQDGCLIVSVPQKYNLYTVYKHRRMREGIWEHGWEQEFSYMDLKRMGHNLGLETVAVSSYGYGYKQDYGFSIIPRILRSAANSSNPLVAGPGRILVEILYMVERKFGHFFMQNITVVYRKK